MLVIGVLGEVVVCGGIFVGKRAQGFVGRGSWELGELGDPRSLCLWGGGVWEYCWVLLVGSTRGCFWE